MTEKIIVVDDLYDIPHQYHTGFFENNCIISEETVQKISEIIGNSVEIIDASNEVSKEGDDTSVCSHLIADWIAVIYLSLPMISFGESGMKFYSHLSTGLESFPTSSDLQKHNISKDKLSEIFSNRL